MLAHIKEVMEYNNGYISINAKHTKLITSLRTAVEKGEGMLDKETTSPPFLNRIKINTAFIIQ